ncbi:MAG: hypothetical protein R2788_26615 [Saprospiraceae bacterium]
MKIWDYFNKAEIVSWKENVPINSIVVDAEIIFIGRFDGLIVKLKFNKLDNQLIEIEREKCHDGIIRRLMVDDDFFIQE